MLGAVIKRKQADTGKAESEEQSAKVAKTKSAADAGSRQNSEKKGGLRSTVRSEAFRQRMYSTDVISTKKQ